MHTNDVHQRLLAAPLAVYDEDIEDDKKNLTKIQKLFCMNRPSNHPVAYSRRFSHRKRSSGTVIPYSTSTSIEKPSNARSIQIRLVFIHIGEIDTLNERYQADIYFEAKWTEQRINLNTLNLTPKQQTDFYGNSAVRINEPDSAIPWSPQLFIENAIGQIGEQDKWFTIRKGDSKSGQPSSPLLVNIDICEHRRIRGVFWEKLELNHFPADVQDLTISITTHHNVDNCVLVPDQQLSSSINREAFSDQQEWSLYEHVATELRQTQEEYSFENENSENEQKKHPVLAFTCRAARRPGYYYWNGFFLILLITICSFCIFSISPNLPQNRLQITCTLLLTSITFRWVVNRSLPQISYLTTLDIYAIVSIIILVVLCIWHSIIATIIFYHSRLIEKLEPNSIYVIIDRYVFVGLFTIYIVIHIALFIWLIDVPYKRRREMADLDREYAANKCIQINTCQSKHDLVFRRSSSLFDNVPKMKSLVNKRPSDSGVIISNAASFLPIQETSNETTSNAMNMIELREQDGMNANHIIHDEQC